LSNRIFTLVEEIIGVSRRQRGVLIPSLNFPSISFRNALPKDVVSDIELKVKAAVIDDQIFVSAMPMFDKALSAEWRRFKKTIVRRNRSGSRVEPMRSKSAENVLSHDPPSASENSGTL
jgi:hypothetical protein